MQDHDANDLTEEQIQEQRLQRLADVLGCSPQDFGGVQVGAQDIGEMVEMLRLWLAVEAQDDRAMILSLMRRLTGI